MSEKGGLPWPDFIDSTTACIVDVTRTMSDEGGASFDPSRFSPQGVLSEYPAIALLADARSYAATTEDSGGLSGEQLRTAKSITVLRRITSSDAQGLLGERAEALLPGYIIYRDIVRHGVVALGEGDEVLGQRRMESILSVHDLAKSTNVAQAIEAVYDITDHDMGLTRLVADDFGALEGRVDDTTLATLRTMFSSDEALRTFFTKERGIDPAFNVGRHIQGEADFTLFQKTVHEVDPVTLAEFVLDLLGGDGNTNPNGPVKFSAIPPAFNGIAAGLHKLMAAQAKGASGEDLYAIWQELSYPLSDMDRLGLNRSDAENKALTRLAFIGREHQKGDVEQARADIAQLRTALSELDAPARQQVIDILQDDNGLDIGFAPHVMESLRHKVEAGKAYAHLLTIIAQICNADAVRYRPPHHTVTVNLNNKFEWSTVDLDAPIRVTVSAPDANGVSNADFAV
jgi:hypothetical protein